MIDHISVAVRDIKRAEAFYTAVLGPLGLVKLREWPDAAVGYGYVMNQMTANLVGDPRTVGLTEALYEAVGGVSHIF